MTREIPLTQGLFALVDDEDFDLVSQFKWYARRRKRRNHPDVFYALRMTSKNHGKRRAVHLHRFLLDLDGLDYREAMVDHRDGDGLNNQRSNIRIATRSENNANRFHRAGTSSQFKGVTWDAKRQIWLAQIMVQRVRHHLGYFLVEEDAARAYDDSAIKYFGEFARINFGYES